MDIDCDVPIGFSLEELAGSAAARLAPAYPLSRRRYQYAVKIGLQHPQLLEGESDLEALLFLTTDEKQLVQVRAAGYSFNRLRPYTSFDDYVPEIRRTWNEYRELVRPTKVRKLRMRYINRIMLPASPGGSVELTDYLVVRRLSDPDSFVLTGFLDHHSAIERASQNVVNTVLTGLPLEGNRFPVIFDNSAEAVFVTEPDEWPSIEKKLQELRDLTNRVFRTVVTEKCLSLFQQ
ncbi:MAG: TIGR04255 family protein [Gemmatimonadota bacterium]